MFARSLQIVLAVAALCGVAVADDWDAHESWSLSKGFDASTVESPDDLREPEWSAWLATQHGYHPNIVCEIVTYSGQRVDILTEDEAIEVEWSHSWYESIGQSGHYANQTNRKPAVILLSRGDDKEHILACSAVCQRFGIALYVQRVPTRAGKGE